MKVKLQSSSRLRLTKAVKDMLDLGLKEAKDLVDYQNSPEENGKLRVIIDSELTEEQIKAITNDCGVTYTPLSDLDVCERKLQEVTNDDLGVSIHSVDEMSIAWRCKMLFTHEQATRVIAGLHDAKVSVNETHVMHEGNKITMLTVSKTFPSGTRDADIKKFDSQLHKFAYYVCEVVNAEERLEAAKERAIEAFNALRDYE